VGRIAWSFYALAVLSFLLACVTDNGYLAAVTVLPTLIWMVLLWESKR
jgi:hypothetical protein